MFLLAEGWGCPFFFHYIGAGLNFPIWMTSLSFAFQFVLKMISEQLAISSEPTNSVHFVRPFPPSPPPQNRSRTSSWSEPGNACHWLFHQIDRNNNFKVSNTKMKYQIYWTWEAFRFIQKKTWSKNKEQNVIIRTYACNYRVKFKKWGSFSWAIQTECASMNVDKNRYRTWSRKTVGRKVTVSMCTPCNVVSLSTTRINFLLSRWLYLWCKTRDQNAARPTS